MAHNLGERGGKPAMHRRTCSGRDGKRRPKSIARVGTATALLLFSTEVLGTPSGSCDPAKPETCANGEAGYFTPLTVQASCSGDSTAVRRLALGSAVL